MSGNQAAGCQPGPGLKVAVPADGLLIAQHFSQAPAFAVAVVRHQRVGAVTIVPCRRHPPGGYAGFLANLGVELVLAAGIGEQVTAKLQAAGIRVEAGASGTIEHALRRVAEDLEQAPA